MLKKILALAIVCAAAVSAAEGRSTLYVANSQGDDITVIDLATQKIVTTFKVGSHRARRLRPG